MKEAYIVWVLLISLISFVMYGIDKNNAIKGKWRIKENTLLILCAIGGGPGGLFGMYFFHHKTRHTRFRAFVPFCVIVWILVGIFVFTK